MDTSFDEGTRSFIARLMSMRREDPKLDDLELYTAGRI
jgi:hypothetical protein